MVAGSEEVAVSVGRDESSGGVAVVSEGNACEVVACSSIVVEAVVESTTDRDSASSDSVEPVAAVACGAGIAVSFVHTPGVTSVVPVVTSSILRHPG